MPYILVNNATSIEIDITAALKYTINKGDFDVILESTGLSTDAGTVVIVLRSHAITERYIRLDWREVSSPVGITSAIELRDLLLSWNIPSILNTVLSNAVDGVTNAIKSIDYAHHEIHSGNHFKAGYGSVTQALNTGAIINVLFVTPDSTKVAHWTLVASATAFCKIELFEGTTASNNGTAITRWNRNRNSLTVSTTLAFHTPTITTDGNKVSTKYIGGEGFKTTIGGESRGDSELMLKKNTKYLIRGTALADNMSLQVGGDWYEHISEI